ncbi:type II toxin-antitoxin system VapC family toxin [Phyllobacterium sp. SB3]|uniref:type II toxin-antitoxin system VapC family toxin n=1 Tax=Phyllobacterium sp. SB3 TaxID=3156073 RepID=UPI0032AF94AB
MIVLDTNVISELLNVRADNGLRNWLVGLEDTPLATTSITIAEIEFGIQRLPAGIRRDQLQKAFETYIRTIPVLPLDDVAAYKAGQYRALRESTGKPTTLADMMIAGIVSVVGGTLATRNTKDFTGLPLQIIDPWQVQ